MDLHSTHMDMDVLAKSKTISFECHIYNVETLPENTIGDRVKKLRLKQNLTIKELAAKCNISPETISKIEKSHTNLHVTTIFKISQALNTTNKYLLGADNWPENNPSEIIYKYRMISGLSQRQLAKLCNLNQSTIRDYEKGRIANPKTLLKIYKVLGYDKEHI